ncbi:MAG: site-specific DNA-methyltransferase, partial [Abitibacteriaceae bacterium]|nr:site-specific DNA-methyltransferase [Abditibacteriaceae bacterium]
MIGDNRFICGDAVKEMSLLPGASIDLLVADPPYNLGKDYGNNIDNRAWNEYEFFTRRWLTEAMRVLKPTGSIYVFMGVRFISKLFLILENDLNLNFNGWITWHYTQGMGRKAGFSPRHEDILFFTKSQDYTFNIDDIRIPQKYYRERNNMAGANPGDVWQFSHVHYCSEERQDHPTQKPEALLDRIVRASSNPNDLILDPFVGSGTTCRVADILQRKWIGIDINPDYISMGQHRVASTFKGLDSIDPRVARTPKDLP